MASKAIGAAVMAIVAAGAFVVLGIEGDKSEEDDPGATAYTCGDIVGDGEKLDAVARAVADARGHSDTAVAVRAIRGYCARHSPGARFSRGVSVGCTLVGPCWTGLVVQLHNPRRHVPAARAFRACLDERCRVGRNRWLVFLRAPARSERKATATLAVLDRAGRTLAATRTIVRLETQDPNGPHCPPRACFLANVHYDAGANRLVEARQP